MQQARFIYCPPWKAVPAGASQGIQVVKIAGVFHIVAAVREQIPVQINEIVVGHAGNIVHNDLIGLGFFVGHFPGVVGLVYIIYMVTEDGGVLLFQLQVFQKLLVDLLHHWLYHTLENGSARLVGIDHGVILPLIGLHRLEVGLVQHDIGLTVAVFNDIDHQIIDDLGVDASDHRGGEGAALHHLDLGCVLPVLAQIGNNVGDAHHIAFQGGRLDLVGVAGDGVGLFQLLFELFKAVQGHRPVFRQLDLTVVTGNAGECLQCQIQREDLIQYPY